MGNSKSHGNDELDARSLKLAAGSLINPLTFLINQSIKNSTFANQWKVARLIPLHKGKGMSKMNPDNFRPIALLPVVSKLVERAVQSQLLDYMNTSGQLNRNHHAYCSNFSTTIAMTQLMARIYTATDRNLITTIDESAAFDVVRHDILIDKMKLYNFSDNSTEWFKSYLSRRSQFVSIQTKNSKMSSVITGVPQGSVLGPLMYTLYINKLPEVVKDNINCQHNISNSRNFLVKTVNHVEKLTVMQMMPQ